MKETLISEKHYYYCYFLKLQGRKFSGIPAYVYSKTLFFSMSLWQLLILAIASKIYIYS